MTTTRQVSFYVMAIPPSRNHYVKVSRRGGYKTAGAKAFEKEIWALGVQARQNSAMHNLERCRVEITLFLVAGGLTVDVDNAPKLVLDGLKNAGFYKDDKAVRQMEVSLEELPNIAEPRTLVVVKEL